jgi:hypothetical protein
LTAFETGTHVTAFARALTFVTAATGFAEARTNPATNTLTSCTAARCGTQGIQLHLSVLNFNHIGNFIDHAAD